MRLVHGIQARKSLGHWLHHREQAHVFRRGQLDVDERDFLFCAELRQRITGSWILIIPQRLERFVGHAARLRKGARAFADPLALHLLLALRPVIVPPQMMRKKVRPIPNYSRGDLGPGSEIAASGFNLLSVER